jgi:hypothetical protein
MNVVFTYLPIRLKEITEIYLKYSIENLNNQNIIPIIYSDKDYFKDRLKENLPVENFFDWASVTLKKEYKNIETEKLFALTTLLFEDDLQLEFDEKKKNKKIKTDEYTLKVPNIAVSNYGIF